MFFVHDTVFKDEMDPDYDSFHALFNGRFVLKWCFKHSIFYSYINASLELASLEFPYSQIYDKHSLRKAR